MHEKTMKSVRLCKFLINILLTTQHHQDNLDSYGCKWLTTLLQPKANIYMSMLSMSKDIMNIFEWLSLQLFV